MFGMFLWYVRHVPLTCSACSFSMFNMLIIHAHHVKTTCTYMFFPMFHVPCACSFLVARLLVCFEVCAIIHRNSRLFRRFLQLFRISAEDLHLDPSTVHIHVVPVFVSKAHSDSDISFYTLSESSTNYMHVTILAVRNTRFLVA